MEDQNIIDLYYQRSDQAIAETQTKYGRFLRTVAYGILRSMEDSEECENETYLKAWNAIPPARPSVFRAFLGKITRNLALDRYDEMHAAKRGSGEMPVLLDELAECLPAEGGIDEHLQAEALTKRLDTFLGTLRPDARNIFLRRYWFGDTVDEIALHSDYSVSKVKMSLSRSRKALKAALEKEGYQI